MSNPTTPQFCAYCGAALRPQANFCGFCGRAQLGYADMTRTGLLISNHLLKQRYRIQRRLGQGGMGAVYQADDALLHGAQRAVKEMSQSGLSSQEFQEATARFQQEAMLLAGLMHPQLPRIYDYFEEDGRWYLVMDFIRGDTLEARLDRAPGGKLPLEDVLDIGGKLCSVLQYLHTHQPPIIFRDLKPANVMLTPESDLYLIDFGIARLFKPDQAKDTMVLGSPGYAAPEQYGKAQTTASADIYSLGATLHQLLSGHDPTQTPFQFPPLELGSHPTAAALAALVRRMVEMDRAKRPASIQEVKQALQHMVGQQPGGSGALSTTTRPNPPAPQKGQPKQEFFAGERVKHSAYGTGTVIRGSADFSKYRSDYVQVDFGGQYGKLYLDMRKHSLEKVPSARPTVQSPPTAPQKAKPQQKESSKQEFFFGEYVKHAKYGTGRVTRGTMSFPDRGSVEVDFGGQLGKQVLDLARERLEKNPDAEKTHKGVQSKPAVRQPKVRTARTKVDWLVEGDTYNAARRYAQALAAYERALLLDPNYADAWKNKGDVLHKLHRSLEAQQAYQKALQLGWKR